MAFLLLNTAVGIIQLVIAIAFAVAALYIAFLVLGWITKGIDEEKELAGGNAAVGILVASVFIAIALVVQSGVSGLSVGINKALSIGIFTGDGITTVVVAIAQLLLGIVLAIGGIYLALNILSRLTKGIDEFQELKKGNVAVALEMAGVIIAVAVIIQTGVIGITASIL
jgi:uncharacterized membrane protein YjfL (UPF0719 family)